MSSTVLLTSSPRSALRDSSFKDTMRSGMVYLQHVSCLDNSNHTGAGRALLSIWTLFRCQSAQEIVRYRMTYRYTYHEQLFSKKPVVDFRLYQIDLAPGVRAYRGNWERSPEYRVKEGP